VDIEDIRWYTCGAGWRNWVFIEVETDTGLVGVGEATIEGRELTIEGHLADLRRALVGTDALDIAGLRQRLTRDPFWVGGYVAGSGLAGIEIALWDILGKHLGVPVWQLLGGRLRDSVPTYANGWYFGATTIAEWVERAGQVVEQGFSALKFDPFGRAGLAPAVDEVDLAIEIIGALRAAVGPKVDLLIEGHGRFGVHGALTIARRLAPFGCMFFEEPVPPGNPDALLHVARQAPLPIAAGERAFSRQDARRMLELGAVHVLQPDVIHAGGIAETRDIAALAETWGVTIAPHNPNGAVATAATLMIDAVIPNFLIQEMLEPWDVPWRHLVVRGCPAVVGGRLAIPATPGLGVELDHQEIQRHPYKPVDLSFWSADSVMETVDLRPS
jgi:galactonate dehydratase